jgi:hypothetical protein
VLDALDELAGGKMLLDLLLGPGCKIFDHV